MAGPDFFRKDLWMIQELCDLGRRWKVACLSDGLRREDLPPWVGLHADVAAASDALSDSGPVAVMPDGPRGAPIP